jgi:hypothetical protein
MNANRFMLHVHAVVALMSMQNTSTKDDITADQLPYLFYSCASRPKAFAAQRSCAEVLLVHALEQLVTCNPAIPQAQQSAYWR